MGKKWKDDDKIYGEACSYNLVDKLNESICIVQRRTGSHFFASDECLEDPFCLAA